MAVQNSQRIPEIGFLRLYQVLDILQIGRTTFLNGVKNGVYPAPVKLSPRTVAWKIGEIRALVDKLGGE